MYKEEVNEILEKYNVDATNGLSASEVDAKRSECGYNELISKKKQSLFVKFLLQFKDVLIIILLIAAVVTLIIDPSDWIESAIIFLVIIVNAILGVFQENKAEKSLEALKKMSSPLCKVVRDGEVLQIETRELVTGDIIVIEAGDFIPADARIIECSNLQVDESALTGESVAVDKTTAAIISDEENIPLGNRTNMLFSSTFITNGRGKAIVTGVGMNTEIGKIASMLSTEENTITPLQHKLNQVGKIIGILSIAICVVVFILEMITTRNSGNPNYVLDAFKIAVTLAVAAIPEGLATVVTIVLAIGVSNMSKEKAIVKKLPAVETLGSTSVICSDKTGTLTQNKMTVVEIYNGSKKALNEINEQDKIMISYFALCCDAKITYVDGVEKRIGDPTETALIELNNKYGVDITKVERVADLPFDSDRKMMTVVVKIGNKYLSITKGAPDIIIKNSNIDKNKASLALDANINMGNRALRILGVAIREFDSFPEVDFSLETNMEFLGLVGMIDPERPEVKDAITIATHAGIRTIMITGDHIITATAIAKNLGILTGDQVAISSEELQKLSDEELFDNIERYSVYARVSPQDKVRIVDTWQKKGMVVSMTGDGVNDSPALKRADIGCAMGITGTDVAKEAAEMILADDNFATIVTAVKEGRGIYNNVKKCVKYLLSSNIGEVLTIFLASIISLFGWPLGVPLGPIHLLWINLITDSLPAFGLGMEKATDEEMKEKPRPKTEGFFANKLGLHIALEGVIIGLLTLTAYIIGNSAFNDHVVGQTMAFLTLSSCQLFHSYNVKTDTTLLTRKTFNNKALNIAFIIGFVLQVAVIYIPGLNDVIFKFSPLTIAQFAISVGIAFMIVVIMEFAKLIGYRKKK